MRHLKWKAEFISKVFAVIILGLHAVGVSVRARSSCGLWTPGGWSNTEMCDVLSVNFDMEGEYGEGKV